MEQPLRQNVFTGRGPSRTEKFEEGSRSEQIEICSKRVMWIEESFPLNPLPCPTPFEPENPGLEETAYALRAFTQPDAAVMDDDERGKDQSGKRSPPGRIPLGIEGKEGDQNPAGKNGKAGRRQVPLTSRQVPDLRCRLFEALGVKGVR